jgi:ArsR family transcriptional regulator
MDLHAALKALADPTRLRIVEFLLDPEQTCCGPDEGVCSCDLESFLELSQPTVHHHMRILLRGRWIYYALAPDAFRDTAAALARIAAAAEANPRPAVTPGPPEGAPVGEAGRHDGEGRAEGGPAPDIVQRRG